MRQKISDVEHFFSPLPDVDLHTVWFQATSPHSTYVEVYFLPLKNNTEAMRKTSGVRMNASRTAHTTFAR